MRPREGARLGERAIEIGRVVVPETHHVGGGARGPFPEAGMRERVDRDGVTRPHQAGHRAVAGGPPGREEQAALSMQAAGEPILDVHQRARATDEGG